MREPDSISFNLETDLDWVYVEGEVSFSILGQVPFVKSRKRLSRRYFGIGAGDDDTTAEIFDFISEEVRKYTGFLRSGMLAQTCVSWNKVNPIDSERCCL